MVDRRGLVALAELRSAYYIGLDMERSTFMVDRRGIVAVAELRSAYYTRRAALGVLHSAFYIRRASFTS